MAYARTTLTVMRARLLERVGGSGKFWVTAELDYAINEALAVWNLLTGDFTITEAPSVTAGFESDTLQTDALTVFRATADGVALTPTTVKDLDQEVPSWEAAANGTMAYWFPRGAEVVRYYPPASGSVTLTQYEYDGGQQLTNAGDFVQVGDDDVNAIIDYAHAYLTFKEGPGEGTEGAKALLELFHASGVRRGKWLQNQDPYQLFMGYNKPGEASKPVGSEGVR